MRGRLGFVVVAAVVTLCAWAEVPASAAPPSSVPPPATMAAIGDSFTLGWAACGSSFSACPAMSWSTGTSLDSLY